MYRSVKLPKVYFVAWAWTLKCTCNLKSLQARRLESNEWTWLGYGSVLLCLCTAKLIRQSHPPPDTTKMHLAHCQQLQSLKHLVKFACYRFNIFKIPPLAQARAQVMVENKKGRAPHATPRHALTINHGCQSSCGLPLGGGNSHRSGDECTGFSLLRFD